MRTVGLLHPGEMGASIGAALRRAGVQVFWVSAGRGPATRRRGQAADLTDAAPFPAGRPAARWVSVCPPHAAGQVAGTVAALGFRGIYVDANAGRAHDPRALGAVLEQAAAVCGRRLIGGRSGRVAATRLYLSGPTAGGRVAVCAH